jgi:hypothetical protein
VKRCNNCGWAWEVTGEVCSQPCADLPPDQRPDWKPREPAKPKQPGVFAVGDRVRHRRFKVCGVLSEHVTRNGPDAWLALSDTDGCLKTWYTKNLEHA